MAYLDPEFSPLPDGWASKELQDVVEIHNTKRQPLNGREREGRKGIYPYCGANGVVDYIDDYRFDGEYVLIAEDGGYWGKHQPSSYIMRGKFWVNNHAHVVCAKDGETTNVFFSQILNYLNIDPFIGGDARGKLTKAILTQLAIPLPPLPEQKEIAHILSTVQRAIEAQERIIQTTTELKKALMHKLFTEGLPRRSLGEGGPPRHEPQKQTEIGPVPESWEVVKLGELFETQLGKMLSQKARTGSDPKPYLRNKNVQWREIDTTDLLLMDFDRREEAKFTLLPGDLLVCEGGQPGRAAIWRGQMQQCYYQKALHRLRPKDKKIANDFLLHWLEFAIRYQNIYKLAGASTIAHLPEVQLKALAIPLPSTDEQAAIVECLNLADTKESHHLRKRDLFQDLFRTILHELMTAKLRVHELDFSTGEHPA